MSDTRVVAKVALLDHSGNVLVLRRSQYDPLDPGTLDFPGGRAEPGESIIQAVIRETEEETGITLVLADVQIAFAKSVYEAGTNKLLVLCIASIETTQDITLSSEHDEFSWMPIKKLTSQKKMHHPVWVEGVDYILKHNLV